MAAATWRLDLTISPPSQSQNRGRRGSRRSQNRSRGRAESPDEFGQALLGNSITLTPGTVTLDDHEGELVVHCLTDATAKDLEAGGMNRRIAALTRF